MIKEGDLVQIREDLDNRENCGGYPPTQGMSDMGGEIHLVNYIDDSNAVYLKNDKLNYNWAPDMLEKIELIDSEQTDLEVGDKVKIKENEEVMHDLGSYWVDSNINDNLGEIVTISDFDTVKKESKAFHVEEISSMTAFMPGMVDKIVKGKTKSFEKLYYREEAENGNLVEYPYEGILEIKNKDEKIESNLVTYEKAKELAKEYHQEKIDELS